MRGLDAWITGQHDPNAPFNETHWTETPLLSPVLDKCDWITEEQLDDEAVSEELGRIIGTVVEEFLEHKRTGLRPYLTLRERADHVRGSASELAEEARQLWEKRPRE
jgi:hypothetical protein